MPLGIAEQFIFKSIAAPKQTSSFTLDMGEISTFRYEQHIEYKSCTSANKMSGDVTWRKYNLCQISDPNKYHEAHLAHLGAPVHRADFLVWHKMFQHVILSFL